MLPSLSSLADVVLRIVTHIHNHQGQILAMCPALG
jgi:hypothetical protein